MRSGVKGWSAVSVSDVVMPRRAGAPGLFALALACAACIELAAGSDRLESAGFDGDEGADAGALPVAAIGRDCLGQPSRAVAVPRRARVILTLAIHDVATGMPPAAVSARACRLLDVQCESPVAAGTASASEVALHLSLAQDFRGFVEITSTGSVPTLFFLNRPLQRDRFEALSTITITSLQALAASAGVALREDRGHLLLRVFDCDGAAASGVAVSSGARGEPFTFRHGFPATGSSVTTAEGLAGFVNVPPGLTVARGRELETGRSMGEASVVVRPGWLTYGDIAPEAQ